eukprot:scaffold7308_cov114-Isochrysis_galbana.AAC.7
MCCWRETCAPLQQHWELRTPSSIECMHELIQQLLLIAATHTSGPDVGASGCTGAGMAAVPGATPSTLTTRTAGAAKSTALKPARAEPSTATVIFESSRAVSAAATPCTAKASGSTARTAVLRIAVTAHGKVAATAEAAAHAMTAGGPVARHSASSQTATQTRATTGPHAAGAHPAAAHAAATHAAALAPAPAPAHASIEAGAHAGAHHWHA